MNHPEKVLTVMMRKSLEPFLAGLGVPGRWWVWPLAVGSKVVMICCPECRRIISISDDHKIADDGTVTPSCKCPTGYCDFHAKVKLEGWEPFGKSKEGTA